MNEKNDLFAELDFAQYYQLNNVPETALLMEAEFFAQSGRSTIDAPDPTSLEKRIIFALGFISTLLLSSGILLHRSLNITPAKSEINSSKKVFTFDTDTFSSATSVRELNKSSKRQLIDSSPNAIEFLAHKNAIAHGKF
jgi:hypothetical protein